MASHESLCIRVKYQKSNVGLSQPGSFYKRSSEMLQLKEKKGKDEGHSPGNYPKDQLLNNSESSSGWVI